MLWGQIYEFNSSIKESQQKTVWLVSMYVILALRRVPVVVFLNYKSHENISSIPTETGNERGYRFACE